MNLKNTLTFAALVSGLIYLSACDSDEPSKGVVIDDQLAHYTFEDNANDLIGSNDGDTENAVFLAGNNGQAAQFNGNGFVHFPDAFDYRERTVSLWFKAIMVNDLLSVIYACDNDAIDYGMTILSVINDANGSPRLAFNASGETFDIAIQEGQWYHAVITVDAEKYAFYLDGEKVEEGDVSDNNFHSGNGESGALLGTSRVFDRFFTGQVDDMRIYDRVLSDKEVSALYEDEN